MEFWGDLTLAEWGPTPFCAAYWVSRDAARNWHRRVPIAHVPRRAQGRRTVLREPRAPAYACSGGLLSRANIQESGAPQPKVFDPISGPVATVIVAMSFAESASSLSNEAVWLHIQVILNRMPQFREKKSS